MKRLILGSRIQNSINAIGFLRPRAHEVREGSEDREMCERCEWRRVATTSSRKAAFKSVDGRAVARTKNSPDRIRPDALGVTQKSGGVWFSIPLSPFHLPCDHYGSYARGLTITGKHIWKKGSRMNRSARSCRLTLDG